MSRVPILETCFSRLLDLYPRQFRDQFGQEMIATFSALMEERSMGPRRNVLSLALRELTGLLAGAVREQALHRAGPAKPPGHLAVRGAVGFGLGYGLLIVLRYIAPLNSDTGSTSVFDAGLLREVGGFALIGALVVAVLGYVRSSPKRAEPLRDFGRAVLLVAGFAAAGAISTLFIRLAFRLAYPSLPVHAPRGIGILIQTVAQMIAGSLAAAMLGAARWGRRAAGWQSLIGGVVFGVSYLAVVGLRELVAVLPVAWPQLAWVVPLSLIAALCGSLSGALLGLSLQGRKAPEHQPG